MDAKDRIIVALDFEKLNTALNIAESLSDEVGYFKLGLQLITRLTTKGWSAGFSDRVMISRMFSVLRGRLFWDCKLADIPNTVGEAAKIIAEDIKPKFFNVHVSAGRKSVEAAVANKGKSLVLGVTVLTSIDKRECVSVFGAQPGLKVLQFARMLSEAGADGIICSPQELSMVGSEFPVLLKVIPGIRPLWAQANDQKRTMTPGEAVKLGADYLVIGRPITQPPENIGGPVEAARKIATEIAEALEGGVKKCMMNKNEQTFSP